MKTARWLILSAFLLLPSTHLISKFISRPVAALFVVLGAATLYPVLNYLIPHLPHFLSERAASRIGLLLFGLFVAGFAIAYPILNTQIPGTGKRP